MTVHQRWWKQYVLISFYVNLPRLELYKKKRTTTKIAPSHCLQVHFLDLWWMWKRPVLSEWCPQPAPYFKILTYLLVHLFIGWCAHAWGVCVCRGQGQHQMSFFVTDGLMAALVCACCVLEHMSNMWRSEDNFVGLVSFCLYAGYKDGT